MSRKGKKYYNIKWYKFSNAVKHRDGNKCLKCGRQEPEVILQAHHNIYKPELDPWEYPLSDCITLCKGCHAREHGLIEPDSGWSLISIEDLEALEGVCEKYGCGTEIRYEHLTYHPKWGYKIVGSTCVEYLTREDQFLSKDILKLFRNISDFVTQTIWEEGLTKKNKKFLFAKYGHHEIRIYGKTNYYSFQPILKEKGEKWHEYKDLIWAKNRTLEQVKELGYIVLKGLLTENKRDLELLRNIYKRLKQGLD